MQDKESQTETVKNQEDKPDKEKLTKSDVRSRRHLQPKWTDTGSMSSGVSSDLSSYDDAECGSREGMEPEERNISDEDLRDEVDDKHYIQHEVGRMSKELSFVVLCCPLLLDESTVSVSSASDTPECVTLTCSHVFVCMNR